MAGRGVGFGVRRTRGALVRLNAFDSVLITPEQFRRYLPAACEWVEEQERLILDTGIQLTRSQRADAKLAGVVHPERVRLLRVDQIPVPDQPLIRAAAQAMKMNTPF